MGPSIDLWFVRHGESKNNAILNAAGGLGAVMYPVHFTQDPLITSKGISVATENGERLVAADVKFDLVLTSCMIRTMETSYYMFVKSKLIEKIHVVPFISEIPLTFGGIPIYENMPLNRIEQIKALGKAHGSDLLDRLDFSLIGGPTGNNDETLPPNGDHFLRWLYSQSLIQDLLKDTEETDRVIRIGVVTHSNFLMKKETLGLEKKPSNADIWTCRLHVMNMEQKGEEILTLTDLAGWYREDIAIIKEMIEKKIEKTDSKLEKKTVKYTKKLEKLATNSSDEILDEDDLEKIKKKELKYHEKLEKKHDKLTHKLELLEIEKEKHMNIADIQIRENKLKLSGLGIEQ